MHNSTRFGTVFLFLLVVSAFAFTQSSCVTMHCKKETCKKPDSDQFERIEIPVTSGSEKYPAWHTRSHGKPVLMLHAMNGISPETLHLALQMESWGYRVYLPSLYGDPIKGKCAYGYDNARAAAGFLKKDDRWNLDSKDCAGPILNDIEDMAKWIRNRERGADMIVIGNCLTGSFPIALLDIPEVKVAVIAQPAMPVKKLHQLFLKFPQSKEKRRALSIPVDEKNSALQAMKCDPEKRIVGFHYSNDPIAPVEKFDALHNTLTENGLENRFQAYVLSPPGVTYTEDRNWVTGSDTQAQREFLSPHSTIINPATCSDRTWFRQKLREALQNR